MLNWLTLTIFIIFNSTLWVRNYGFAVLLRIHCGFTVLLPTPHVDVVRGMDKLDISGG